MPKKTLAVIIDSGNDYCVQVKGNQGKLLANLQQTAGEQKPIDVVDSREKNRGRLEHRRVQLFVAPPHWSAQYVGLTCFAVVRRWGFRAGRSYDQRHYYIFSRPLTLASQAAACIRGHWSIENRLHYVKDVTMGEDKNGIRHQQAAKNISLLKNFALNLVRLKGGKCVKTARDRYAHNVNALFEWLL